MWSIISFTYSTHNVFRAIKLRRVKWIRPIACVGEMKNAYKILVGIPEEKRPLRKPRSRWDDNIKIDFKEKV
jgi:hypothetical protein